MNDPGYRFRRVERIFLVAIISSHCYRQVDEDESCPYPHTLAQAGTRQLDQSAHINTTLQSPRKCHEVIVVDSRDLGRYFFIMTA